MYVACMKFSVRIPNKLYSKISSSFLIVAEIGSLFIVMDFCEKGKYAVVVTCSLFNRFCISPHINSCLFLSITSGDLYSKINSQRGILFPEEQVNSLWILSLDS